MVKLEDHKTKKVYTIFGPEIQEVGPFKLALGTKHILGTWKMKLRTGERFTAAGDIMLYIELAKILLKMYNEKHGERIEL